MKNKIHQQLIALLRKGVEALRREAREYWRVYLSEAGVVLVRVVAVLLFLAASGAIISWSFITTINIILPPEGRP